MASNMAIKLTAESQAELLAYLGQIPDHEDLRSRMEQIDRSYARESDLSYDTTMAKRARMAGDTSKFRNFEMSTTMPAVEAAVTYQASVFLQGTPLFAVAASPEYMDQAIQLETVLDNQATRGGWTRQFMLAFRDIFKYNLCFLEVSWSVEKVYSIITDVAFAGGLEGKPNETLWAGNKVKRIDPYNVFIDARVPPAELHTRGEYAGYKELMSRVELKAFMESLESGRRGSYKQALESGARNTYYEPTIRQDEHNTTRGGHNWMNWAGLSTRSTGKAYKDTYEVTTLYARIIPDEFGIQVPAPKTPQIWKFIFVNDQVLIYAERQTNAHNYLPILCAQAIEDGLAFQTKTLAECVMPLQDVSTALMNSVIASRRRAVSDRAIYDPSRISEHHVNNPNPCAKIPVRPGAYGEPVQNSYYPIPYRDDQSGLMLEQINMLAGYANIVTGQNPARQGQFVKGNKTRSEFDTIMANANGRDQATAILIEASLMTPLKEILKINVLQYQGAGAFYSRAAEQTVQVDPVQLRNAVLEFKVSDGLTPMDKLMDTDTMIVMMQQIGTSPQLAQGYNIAPLFSYISKLKGADLRAFEKSKEQLAYEQAVEAWKQTVMNIFQANPEVKADQLPPQPTPEQYGYMVNSQGAQQGQ